MNTVRFALAAFALALVADLTMATDWNNPAGGAFDTGGNWLGGVAPGAGDSAIFDLGDSVYAVTLGADVTNLRLAVGDDDVTLDLAGFDYTVTATSDPPRSIVVGQASGDVGALTLTGGAAQAQAIALGQTAGSSGRLTVAASATLTGGGLYVGQNGAGRFDVLGSATTGPVIVGREAGSSGEVHVGPGASWTTNGTASLGSFAGGSTASAFVEGAGASWNATSQMVVGRVAGDIATLTISAGGQVSGDLPLIGNNPGSQGVVLVQGGGSMFSSPRRIHVGVGGHGALTISGGAEVASSQLSSPSLSSGIVGFTLSGGIRGSGEVTITGAGSIWRQDGGMSVGYGGDGVLSIADGGRLESVDGYIARSGGSTGAVAIAGAGSEWEASEDFYLAGDETAAGAPGSLTLTDGGRLSTANLKAWPGATLTVEIDSLALSQGVGVDALAALGGTLALEIDPAFAPGYGDIITGLLAYGSRSGAFDAIAGRELPGGLVLAHEYGASALTLTPALPGDGNLDGAVDGADFTVWADHFGSSEASFTDGDYNADGSVDGADFTLWADHFGEVAPPAAPTPEPSSGLLALAAIAAAWWKRPGCRWRGA